MNFGKHLRCPYCSILNFYEKLDWVMICQNCGKKFKIKKVIEYKTERADDNPDEIFDKIEQCEFKEKCYFGQNCNMDCFNIEEGDIKFQGKIYKYKNNTIHVIQEGLYKAEIHGKEEWFPYDSGTVYGSSVKEIWNLIKYLYQNFNQGEIL